MLLVQPSRSDLKRTLSKALPTLLRTCAKPCPAMPAGVNVVPRYL